MRRIESIEELEALPEGTEVRVQLASGNRNTTVWKRNAAGFESQGSTLQTRFFSGYVADGKVTATEPERPSVPGDWWQFGRYHYLHLFTHENGQLELSEWYRHNFRQVNTFTADFFTARQVQGMTRIAGAPAEVSLIGPHVDSVTGALFRHMESLRPQVEKERVPVTVTAWGTARPSQAGTRKAINAQRGATIERPLVPWRVRYTYHTWLPVGTCGCGTVDMAKVENLLPDYLIESTVQAECPYSSEPSLFT